MTVISIIGTSGVGKSLLVRQLAAIESAPCFLEGEEGAIPSEVLQLIMDKSDPVRLFAWFADRYKRNLAAAHSCGVRCYVDGAIMSIEAHIIEQDKQHHASLRSLLDATDHLQSDIILLLTARAEILRKFLEARGRRTEQGHAPLERSLLLQSEFLRIAGETPGVLVLNRSELDFHDADDLRKVLRMLREAKQ